MWIQTSKGDWINSDYITGIHAGRTYNTITIPVVADNIRGKAYAETITYCYSYQEAQKVADELVYSIVIGVKIKSYYEHKGDTT